MTVNNTPHIRKPDPCALKLLGTVEPSKHTEEFVRVLHIEAYAIVANEEDIFAAVACAPYFN